MSLLLNETDRDLKSPYALTAGGLAHAFEQRATTTEQPQAGAFNALSRSDVHDLNGIMCATQSPSASPCPWILHSHRRTHDISSF